MLKFEDNWQWKGKGNLSPRFRQCTSLQDLFAALISETREAGETYTEFLKNDRRLLGQERHDLADELEDLLGGFFYLYKTLVRSGEGRPFYSRFTERRKNFIIEFDGSLWRAEGVLRAEAVKGSFAQWFNSTLLSGTGKFIKVYGTSLSDGIIDEGELQDILVSLNELILQVLLADKGLKTGVLS